MTDLENSRDDLLYEQHKLENHSEADVRQLQTYFSEAENLSVSVIKLNMCCSVRYNLTRKLPSHKLIYIKENFDFFFERYLKRLVAY